MAGTSKPDAPALSLKFRQLPPEVSKKLGTGPRSMTPPKRLGVQLREFTRRQEARRIRTCGGRVSATGLALGGVFGGLRSGPVGA